MKKKKNMTQKQLANLTGKSSFVDKKLASEAGKKGVEVKREMKTYRDNLNFVLGLDSPTERVDALKALFPTLPDKVSNLLGIALAEVVSAHRGNIQAIKGIREAIDGPPDQNINLKGEQQITLKIIRTDK
jgi:hypothetical protein